MAYEKQTWTCGEEISADKLNHMEDGIANAGGGGDAGYECVESWTTSYENDVTTQKYYDDDTYADSDDLMERINAPTIKVTLNGTEYVLENNASGNGGEYGASYDEYTGTYDFSAIPFVIVCDYYQMWHLHLRTSTAGTYSLKIEILEESVETTTCFQKAVKSITSINTVDTVIAMCDVTENIQPDASLNMSASKFWSEKEQDYIYNLPEHDLSIIQQVQTPLNALALYGFYANTDSSTASIYVRNDRASVLTLEGEYEIMQIRLYKFGNS